jgi:hypothetical protein
MKNLIIAGIFVLLFVWYLTFSATRLDRLHHRVETSWANLDSLLQRAIDGVFLSRKIKREVNLRFPGYETKGLGRYAWLRSTQMRRLRTPHPQVKAGDSI